MINHPQLSTLDLRDFEKKTVLFFESKKLSDGKTYRIFNYNNFMRAQGAMRYDGIYWTICALNLYIELDDKLAQLGKYLRKVAYAKRKEAEEFEKVL